jgi:hypothetical protein
MKRLMLLAVSVALVLGASLALADGAAKPKTGSWKGEVLDAGCYLGHGAMGEKHKECALRCARNGMPLMLMTAEGKAVLLTPNHDDGDPYEMLKGWAGSVVEVTGTMNTRGGVTGIDVTRMRGAQANAARTPATSRSCTPPPG